MTPFRKDIHFFEGLNAPLLDYSAAASHAEREKPEVKPAMGMLIDATRPFVPYPVVGLPPASYLKRARDAWATYGLPELQRSDLPRAIEMEEEYMKEGISSMDHQPKG